MSITKFSNELITKRVWHVIDARYHVVGRLATQVSTLLQGKHKPIYNSTVDCGDYVVVLHADKINFSMQKKWKQKLYRWHTGYPGGFREVPAARMHAKKPTSILQRAVSGMLPKNRTRDERMHRLKLIVGKDNPYIAQVNDPVNQEILARGGAVTLEEARPKGVKFYERRKGDKRKRHVRAKYKVNLVTEEGRLEIQTERLPEYNLTKEEARKRLYRKPDNRNFREAPSDDWTPGKLLTIEGLMEDQQRRAKDRLRRAQTRNKNRRFESEPEK